MQTRLASSVIVSALLRMVERSGGFGTVLTKGDATAGAIILVLTERGHTARVLERLLQISGDYGWGESLGPASNEEDVQRFLQKRRKIDPDSWVLELDTASAERFAAEIAALD